MWMREEKNHEQYTLCVYDLYTYPLLLAPFIIVWCKFADCELCIELVDEACKFCEWRFKVFSGCDGWFCILCVVGIDNGCDSESPGKDNDGIRSIIIAVDLITKNKIKIKN